MLRPLLFSTLFQLRTILSFFIIYLLAIACIFDIFIFISVFDKCHLPGLLLSWKQLYSPLFQPQWKSQHYEQTSFKLIIIIQNSIMNIVRVNLKNIIFLKFQFTNKKSPDLSHIQPPSFSSMSSPNSPQSDGEPPRSGPLFGPNDEPTFIASRHMVDHLNPRTTPTQKRINAQMEHQWWICFSLALLFYMNSQDIIPGSWFTDNLFRDFIDKYSLRLKKQKQKTGKVTKKYAQKIQRMSINQKQKQK